MVSSKYIHKFSNFINNVLVSFYFCVTENGPGAKNANEKLLYMITKDCMPLRTVEKPGFKAYSKALNLSYCPPGKNKVADMVSTQYKFMADKLKQTLSTIEEISLTTDIWTEKYNTQS